jgi:hypothetical protein
VTGKGSHPRAKTALSDRDALPDETGLRLLLTTAALCNNARLLRPRTQRR